MMHPRTIATLEELEAAAWFAHVGERDATSPQVLSSWRQAIEHCGSVDWEDLTQEAVNQFCERLQERSKDRFRAWNDVVAEVKAATIPLARRKIEGIVREHDLPKVFEDTVLWDVLHVGMEAEYADVHPPGFFASQAYWYVRGHFPCGWEGKFPEGRLIIY